VNLYRITGKSHFLRSEERVTATRRGGDLAYYEDLTHAKRGMTGFKAGNRWYSDVRLETIDWQLQDWVVVDV